MSKEQVLIEDIGLDAVGYERELGSRGLRRLDITGDWVIVIPDSPDVVEETAAQELRNFLVRCSLPEPCIVREAMSSGSRRFLVGRWTGIRALRELDGDGVLSVGGISAEDDGFHVKLTRAGIAIAGANPRGALYGVHAFEEFVTDGAGAGLDIRKIPFYKKRGSGISYYFNSYSNVSHEEFTSEKAAYLARLGINQYTGEDFYPALPSFPNAVPVFHLHQLVKSDVFPFQPPPVPELQRKLRSMSAVCRRFSLSGRQTTSGSGSARSWTGWTPCVGILPGPPALRLKPLPRQAPGHSLMCASIRPLRRPARRAGNTQG